MLSFQLRLISFIIFDKYLSTFFDGYGHWIVMLQIFSQHPQEESINGNDQRNSPENYSNYMTENRTKLFSSFELPS